MQYELTKINLLRPDVAYLYPLKTSENVKVFLCFRGGINKATPDCNELHKIINNYILIQSSLLKILQKIMLLCLMQ